MGPVPLRNEGRTMHELGCKNTELLNNGILAETMSQ